MKYWINETRIYKHIQHFTGLEKDYIAADTVWVFPTHTHTEQTLFEALLDIKIPTFMEMDKNACFRLPAMYINGLEMCVNRV